MQKHFSMIRGFHLADFFTLANAACGVGAVFLAMRYMASGDARRISTPPRRWRPAAFFFDVLDGRIARWRQQHSALGPRARLARRRDLLRRRARGAGLRRRAATAAGTRSR